MNEFAVLVTWCLKWHPKAFTLKTERRYNDYIDHYPCSSISSTCTEPFLVLKIGWFWLKLKGLSGTLFLLCFTGKLVVLMVIAISTSLWKRRKKKMVFQTVVRFFNFCCPSKIFLCQLLPLETFRPMFISRNPLFANVVIRSLKLIDFNIIPFPPSVKSL